MFRLFIYTVLLLLPSFGEAAVYKCSNGHGGSVFTDRPCDADTKPLNVHVYNPSASAVESANKALDSLDKSVTADRQQRHISDLEQQIQNKQKEMNSQLDALKTKLMDVNQRRAGAAYRQAIEAEMRATTVRYQAEMEQLNQQLKAAQDVKN